MCAPASGTVTASGPASPGWHPSGPGGHAGVAETHSGVVFFVGDRAYKLKKPLDLGFLDYRSREAREAACHREVELTRRLAPDVFLGVAAVVGPDGQPCDHLVVMRRLPADRRLATLVTSGQPVGEDLRRLARLLARLFSQRRKQVRSILGRDTTLPDDVDPTARPENLTVAQLVALADWLEAPGGPSC